MDASLIIVAIVALALGALIGWLWRGAPKYMDNLIGRRLLGFVERRRIAAPETSRE